MGSALTLTLRVTPNPSPCPKTLALALALALAQARVGTQIAASVLSALGDTAPSDGVIASPP